MKEKVWKSTCRTKLIEILLVEDNRGDVGLVKEALIEGKFVTIYMLRMTGSRR